MDDELLYEIGSVVSTEFQEVKDIDYCDDRKPNSFIIRLDNGKSYELAITELKKVKRKKH